MTIYVDPPQEHPTKLRHKIWSHMVSDIGPDELHAMARRIGLKRSWSQEPPAASSHHYDVTPKYRLQAIAAGARAVSARELVKLSYDGLHRRRLLAQQLIRSLSLDVNEVMWVAAISKDRELGRPLPPFSIAQALAAGECAQDYPNLTIAVRASLHAAGR
jgi:hypothetical protein